MLEGEGAWEFSIPRIDIQSFSTYFDFESPVGGVGIVSDESIQSRNWLLRSLVRLEAPAQLCELVFGIAVILFQFLSL